jgi:hypothetical protein
MKHFRIYTHTGGVVRFTYDMQELLNTVNQETQFVGRNIADSQGNIDLNKMAGPDDIDFVVRSIKGASDVLDAFIPKHAKTEELRVIVFSDKEVTITFNNSGKTSRTVLEQAHEHTRNFLVNTMLKMWFEKVGMANQGGTYSNLADVSIRALQRVLIHSFIIGTPYGSRYPKVNPSEVARPLKGKFLGSYKTEDVRDEVHGDYEAGDICYIETEYDYMVYDGAAWGKLETLVDALTAGDKLNAKDHIDFPEANAGDVFFVTKTGTIGDYKDKVYAGEVLVCVEDNEKGPADPVTYKDSLMNFLVLGPVKADVDH